MRLTGWCRDALMIASVDVHVREFQIWKVAPHSDIAYG
jgi:hypothetical protein